MEGAGLGRGRCCHCHGAGRDVVQAWRCRFLCRFTDRSGTNAQHHLVDERIVGGKPSSLDWAAAAALPLTAITAWEMLFDRLDVRKAVAGAANAIVIIGGAGGVGSIAIQLARQLTDLTVIATASRSETATWARQLGAHHVVDHAKPLAAEVAGLGLGAPALVFSTTNTDAHLAQIAELIAPQGRFGLIDDPKTLDFSLLKRKSLSLHWEFMFTRPMFATADIAAQGALLNEVARLVDAGTLRTTLGESYGVINAANLRRAHALSRAAAPKARSCWKVSVPERDGRSTTLSNRSAEVRQDVWLNNQAPDRMPNVFANAVRPAGEKATVRLSLTRRAQPSA